MRNKLIIALTFVVFLLFSIIPTTATDNRIFYLTDPASDISYTVTVKGDTVTVSDPDQTCGYTKIKDVLSLSIYGGMLNLYTIDRANEILCVFYFDFCNDAIDSTSFNAFAFDNTDCFACDGEGNVYFVSGNNTCEVCIYINGVAEYVNLKSPIKQLLCIGREKVIAVTNDNVCVLSGTSSAKVLDHTLAEPISYIGNNTVKDLSGDKYLWNNDTLQAIIPATEITAAESTESTEAKTSPIPDGNIPDFYFANPGVTVSKIKKAFAHFEISKVTKANGNDIKSGKLGTGAKVYFADGSITEIIIPGELTGEGNINSRDLKAILNHLSKKELLKGASLIAADVNNDGDVTTKDALMIAKMY